MVESFAQRAKANAFAVKASWPIWPWRASRLHVQSLIAAYRFARLPLGRPRSAQAPERPKIPELEPAFYDLSESDMDITFSATNTYFTKAEHMTPARDPAGPA